MHRVVFCASLVVEQDKFDFVFGDFYGNLYDCKLI